MQKYTHMQCVLKNFFTGRGGWSKSGVTGMGACLGTLSGYFPLDSKQEKTAISHLWYCSALSQRGDRLQSADAKAPPSWQYANYWGEERSHLSHLPAIKRKRAFGSCDLSHCLYHRTFLTIAGHLAIIDTTSNKTRKCFRAGLGPEGSLQDAEHLLQGAHNFHQNNQSLRALLTVICVSKEKVLSRVSFPMQ